jgi:hypothetical protein
MNPLLRVTRPVPVPAKTRLLATVKEIARLIDALPDPLCDALEKSGVVSSWRMQIASVEALATRMGTAGQVVTTAASLAAAIRRVVGR